MHETNMTNNTQYAVWFREGLEGTPFILADAMTRDEAATLLDRLAFEPGDGAGYKPVLPGERASV